MGAHRRIGLEVDLFQVKSGPLIMRLHCIQINEHYMYMYTIVISATRGSETFVAMSYTNEVRVHRLRSYRLEELAQIETESLSLLLSFADRLIATEWAEGRVNTVSERQETRTLPPSHRIRPQDMCGALVCN